MGYGESNGHMTDDVMLTNITFLSFLLFSMCQSIQVVVNTWLNCSFFYINWIMAAILDLRQNLRWPRSIFQIVWSKVHESTEKTLTGKKGSFYLARPLLYIGTHRCTYTFYVRTHIWVHGCRNM